MSDKATSISTKKKTIIGYAFTLVALAYFLKHAYSNFDEISSYEWSLWQFAMVPLSSVLVLLISLLSGIAWHTLLADQGARTTLKINLSILCTSQIAKYIPGNIGQYFGRIYFSKNHGIPAGITTVAMVIETLWLIFIAAALSIITLLLFGDSQSTPKIFEKFGISQLLFVAFVCLLGPILFVRLTRVLATFFDSKVLSSFQPPNIFISLRVWAIDLFIFLVHGILVTVHILLFSNGHTPDILLNTVLYASVWLAGYIFPGAPAGLGVREAATFAIFSHFYDTPTCITISISLRLASIVGDVLTYMAGRHLEKS